ncbi:hypothetical protein [Vibrio rotiferianus]|uniref:hypothetical protein n=1 Tax=Vibrio rotiferianus TaxID=190895 RepID=UPI00111057A0|nr:hypothetical protein [Vibrio rotiferianus]
MTMFDAKQILGDSYNFDSYNRFRNSVNLSDQIKLSKSENRRLKIFYKLAKEALTSGKNILTLEEELISVVSSINLDAAKKRWVRLRQTKKPKRKRGRKPSLKVDLSAEEILKSRRGTPRIGLGLESQVNIPRVKSREVVVDKNTSTEKVTDKHILYAAGWNLEGAFSK